MKDTSWMEDAACRGVSSPDIFYPTSQGPLAKLDAQSAIAICRDCQVISECAEYARTASRGFGVWAGKLKPSREPMGLSPVNHGTDAGYAQHRRRGQEACASCLRAHNLARDLRNERRRA